MPLCWSHAAPRIIRKRAAACRRQPEAPLPVRRRARPCGFRGLAANLVRAAWALLGGRLARVFQLANPYGRLRQGRPCWGSNRGSNLKLRKNINNLNMIWRRGRESNPRIAAAATPELRNTTTPAGFPSWSICLSRHPIDVLAELRSAPGSAHAFGHSLWQP